MQVIGGFGIDIRGNEVFYQCPNCNPNEPYNLGSYQKLIHKGDNNNDGLADILGIHWKCPGIDCKAYVGVPYEDKPQFAWGFKLKEIFKQKEIMFKKITVDFTGLDVSIGGSPDYLDDTFSLIADVTYDKKFKIYFAVNNSDNYDLYISTQLQDDGSDWGAIPSGWIELDCVMMGLIKIGASSINQSDVKHILDSSKVTGLI